MNLKHKVRINLSGEGGTKEMILEGGETKIRSKILDHLLGKRVGVLVLTLGASVSDVEVTGVMKGGEVNAT